MKMKESSMTEKQKSRSIFCTDQEWEAIRKKAEDQGLSISKFIINLALQKETIGVNSSTIEEILEHVKAGRNATRLLVAVCEQEFVEKGKIEEFEKLKTWALKVSIPE
jgi:hypothetical protein